ncbi:MAG TPA: hypothetical protein VJ622_11250 [Acidimicrobiia bacterium]|nr:hypothetical protein [Acidimicrobiia bacterium]
MTQVDPFPHRRRRTDENSVAGRDITAHRRVRHDACIVPEGRVMPDRRHIRDHGVVPETDEGREVGGTEDDRPRPELHPHADVGGRVNNRRGRPTPVADALGDGVTGPRPAEAEHIGGVVGDEVVDGAEMRHTPPGETAGIDLAVIEEAEHTKGRPDHIDSLDDVEDVTGMPAASDEQEGQQG